MSKAEILTAIRRGLRRGPLPADQKAMLEMRSAAHPRHLIPARTQLDRAALVQLFIMYAEREFATVARLPGLSDVPEAVTAYLAQHNAAQAITVSPHPDLQSIPFAERPLLQVQFGTATPADQTSLQMAFAGIAETGTLMLASSPERPTLNNLLPDNAIVVLREKSIAGSYEDAFDQLREAGGMPRSLMLVTGPSRSADIEQTLELGAHGPRRLHILIIDGEG